MRMFNRTSKATKKFGMITAMMLLLAPVLKADPANCQNCTGCSNSALQCGICIWVIIETSCAEWGPKAMASCQDDGWTIDCAAPMETEASPMVF